MDEITLENWPDCIIPNCKYKRCLALDSVFCHPHTKENNKGDKMRDLLEEGLDFEPLTVAEFMIDDDSVELNKAEWVERYENFTNIFGVKI